ncbi:MAG: Nif3-like dinuclear metal center hexameric protein [Ktedonobacterales bacterium]|nr:Nif3-like dinuclear metal center hexameric protein [Ktedonobacterales bacterium]
MPVLLTDIAVFLDDAFQVERFPADLHGVVVPSERPVRRIGLALEPWPGLAEWVRDQALDALLLHRHFRLDVGELPAGVGVLAYHLAFDAALTFAENPRLAAALGMRGYTLFAPSEGLPRGMVGDIAPTAAAGFISRLVDIFGVAPTVHGVLLGNLRRIVLANALSAALVHEAVAQDVHCYLTGQFRPAAAPAMRATGLPVFIIGHAVGEHWGLRALAGMLQERWAQIAVVIAPASLPPASSAPAV